VGSKLKDLPNVCLHAIEEEGLDHGVALSSDEFSWYWVCPKCAARQYETVEREPVNKCGGAVSQSRSLSQCSACRSPARLTPFLWFAN